VALKQAAGLKEKALTAYHLGFVLGPRLNAAGRIASESRCKKLLLTHLYPVCDQFDILNQCRQVFQGQTILGEDLMRVRI
jgi:single-stranded DNA-specific DHH superfamily exonuclease